jgi:hypothetical protein
MLRIKHCVDNRLICVVRLSASCASRAVLPRNIFISVSGNDFCQGLSKRQGLVRLVGLGKLVKVIHFFETQARDLSALALTTTPPLIPDNIIVHFIMMFLYLSATL